MKRRYEEFSDNGGANRKLDGVSRKDFLSINTLPDMSDDSYWPCVQYSRGLPPAHVTSSTPTHATRHRSADDFAYITSSSSVSQDAGNNYFSVWSSAERQREVFRFWPDRNTEGHVARTPDKRRQAPDPAFHEAVRQIAGSLARNLKHHCPSAIPLTPKSSITARNITGTGSHSHSSDIRMAHRNPYAVPFTANPRPSVTLHQWSMRDSSSRQVSRWPRNFFVVERPKEPRAQAAPAAPCIERYPQLSRYSDLAQAKVLAPHAETKCVYLSEISHDIPAVSSLEQANNDDQLSDDDSLGDSDDLFDIARRDNF
jgi:hypothetical protein